jgi:hypothetical protein
MNRHIDLKSVLLGGMLVLLVLCLAGAVPVVSETAGGRFQLGTNDSYAFVLDSATGQVWSLSASSSRYGPAGSDPNDFHAPKIGL